MARPPQDSRRGFCQFEKVSVDKAGWISKELIINMTHQGNNFRDSAGQGAARRGNSRQDKDKFPWLGVARRGMARHGTARQLKTRINFHGLAWRGTAGHGLATQDKD